VGEMGPLGAAPDRQPCFSLVVGSIAGARPRCIRQSDNEVLISVAALWERTIEASSGRLSLPDELETMVASQGFTVLSISFPHLGRLAGLPRLHRDPFDRMMIAQAFAKGIPIATGDRVFPAYGVQVIW
jgi:PIN domain nuclease of toxin-antitoxin system